ncbi:MAG: hypothetical protein KGL39_20710 [Patescibacteria group bacterium]|nr:hypothetical protein [Patescibacteria group bacterium]
MASGREERVNVAMDGLLSRVVNIRRNHGWVGDDTQAEAVVAQVMAGWGFDCIEATAQKGVAEADQEYIQEIIEECGLTVTAEKCVAHLLAVCKEEVEETE